MQPPRVIRWAPIVTVHERVDAEEIFQQHVEQRGDAPSSSDDWVLDLRDSGVGPAVPGGQPQMTRISIIVRRLILAVAALICLVSVLLVIGVVTTVGDQAPSAAVDSIVVTDVAENVAKDVEVSESPVASTDTVVASTKPVEEVSAAPVVPPPFPALFEPSPNEVQADAKRLGTAVAYMITNYEPESSTIELAKGVTADLTRVVHLASVAETVHYPGLWSRGTIEYAQLGGNLDGGISILVVVHQELGAEGIGEPERTETRTMDVRLVRNASGAWEFDELASAGGQPVARPADLSPLAASVVDNPRIDLPDSAIWDIYSGHTDHVLLQTMSDIAERTPYSVAALHTGHPDNVFGTDRVSNHTVGRAVDIHELDSELVIDSHEVTSSIYAVAEWLASRSDLKEFGSPWRFDDAVAHTFTNEVHHDHLHVGVFPGGSAAG